MRKGKPTSNRFVVLDSHAELHLPSGHVALLSLDDIGTVSGFSWCLNALGRVWAFTPGGAKARKRIYLHRLILASSCQGLFVDHKNHDPLDNRRENLRACTHAENARNSRTRRHSSTGLTGVTVQRNGEFRARICAGGKRIDLGSFSTPTEAALARDYAASNLHGEFACLNGVANNVNY